MLEKLKEKMTSENKENPIDIVNDVCADLKNYREQFESCWRVERRSYHGVIWENQSEYKPYENNIFSIIETMVPILTDSMPMPVAKMNGEDNAQKATVLSKAIEHVFKKQKFDLMYPMVVRNAITDAPGFIHPCYDPFANNGQGELKNEILRWDENEVLISGNSLFIEQSDSAQFTVFRSRSWLERAYPKYSKQISKMKGEEVTQANDSYRGLEKHDTQQRHRRSVPKPYSNKNLLKLKYTYVKDFSLKPIPEEITAQELESEKKELMEGNSPDVKLYENHKAHGESHYADLTELYSQLNLTPEQGFEAAEQIAQELAQENPDAVGDLLLKIKILENHIEAHATLQKENPKGEMLKYPGGYRVIESLGQTTVYDGVNKYDHGEINLVPFYCYRNGTIFGDGVIRNIFDSQQMQTVMTYKAYKGLQRVANPEKQVDIETGLTEDDITNEDGALYFKPQGTSIQNIPPGVISEQVVRFAPERMLKMRELSGVNEVTEGKTPHPNAAATTVERTQNQAIGRIRLIDRQNTYYSLGRLGHLTACNIIQFWTDEKYLGVDEQSKEEIIFNPLEMSDLEFDVGIASGSMAGVDKQAYNSLLYAQLGAGFITYEEYLQLAEMPRKEKILEMVGARNEQNAALEQVQSQMQQMQIENLKLKAQINPELLSPEERKMLEEILREEEIQKLTGVNQDQPAN